MTIETLRAEIRDFVSNELLKGMVDESELQDNRQMIKDGLIDSIGIMRLLTFLSQTYNIELTDDDFKMKNFESINNICEFVMRK
jgi:acyl carrier protein